MNDLKKRISNEISELENKLIPLAEYPNRNSALPKHIRQCRECHNLVGNDGYKIPITSFQKRYLANNYRNRIAHGLDRECHSG